MSGKFDIKKAVIIRKPTDDEQRNGKIATSDYAISSITIQSSVMKTLGWIDKVYRSKQTNIVYSNTKAVNHTRKQLANIVKNVSDYTPYELYTIKKELSNDFIRQIENAKKWIDITSDIPYIVTTGKFKTPKSLYKVVKATIEIHELFDGILDGMSDYKYDENINMKTLLPLLLEYLSKIETKGKIGQTQAFLWEKAWSVQQKIEKDLGKNFTPKMYALYVEPYRLNIINYEWHLNLENYDGSWEDLCNYLYSPTMIAQIRNKIGVNIRARDKGTTRKGIESVDKKKFIKIIANKKRLLGKDFSISAHEEKIKMAKKNMEIKKNLYDEGKWLLDHAIANNDEKIEELSNAVEVLRNKYNYSKKQYERACTSLTKKKEALDIIREYEQKLGILNEMMEETRSGEELSILEQEETIQAIRNQKKEKQIPYYTWRFVCDKISDSVAAQIEKALEDNLNKGSGINGEDGYINVTSFPMEQSRQFFVDYPKNSNLFRAFRKKGIELSNILIEGVAQHLKTRFVHCKGETFINSPMEKTMGGDMLEWVGL